MRERHTQARNEDVENEKDDGKPDWHHGDQQLSGCQNSVLVARERERERESERGGNIVKSELSTFKESRDPGVDWTITVGPAWL